MKQWMRVLIALGLAAFLAIAGSIVATPSAHASTQEMWVNCQTYFTDGPNAGKTEPVSFLISSGGGMTAYSSDYTAPAPGTWFVNGTTTIGYTFSAHLSVIPNATLTVNHTFTTNTYPVVSTGTGTVVDGSGTLLFVTHTQTTCAYFLPGTSGCLITYAMSQWTGNFTATITIANTGSSAISSGGTLVFVFPGTQTVTTGWNGAFTQSGSTVTAANLGAIGVSGSVSPGFNGAWSGSNPTPVQYTLNGKPCSVNV